MLIKANVQRPEQSGQHGSALSAAPRAAPLPAVGGQGSGVTLIPRVGHHHGTLISKRSKYFGGFLNGLQHGQVVEVWNIGTTYEGSCVNGQKHGSGKFEWPDGSVYLGEFCNDTASGYGERTTKDGCTYKGTFVRGRLCGEGSRTRPPGRAYVGQWRDDEFHGCGIYEHVKGAQKKGERSEGQFVRWLDE